MNEQKAIVKHGGVIHMPKEKMGFQLEFRKN